MGRRQRSTPVAWAAAGFCAAFGAVGPVVAQTAATPPAQTVEIIGTSPLPGQGVDRALLPYTTQVMRRSQVEGAQADNLSDLMQRRLSGVQVNDIQGSPFQGDLTFRGFRASGLLGASQGLSVYLDGVRINEPFGDVINWDMVPEFALDSVALVPGANPAFGLNTLGGAIALTTATGRSAPGVRASASFGSFGRKRLDLSHGGVSGDWQHYVGIGLFDEAGWRDESAGHLGNVVAKVGRQTDVGDFTLSLLAGRSRLVGNGLTPLYTFDDDGVRTPDLGSIDRAAVYTHPDLTRNRLSQGSLSWRFALDARTTLEALAYARNSRRDTINGDAADDIEEGEEEANASFNRTQTRQNGSGLAVAVSGRHGAHQWQAGASADRSRVRYEQTEQEGTFTPNRGVEPLDEPAELSAAVRGHSTTFGVHASDTFRLAPATHLTGTLRLNQSRVSNTLTSVDDDTGEVVERPEESFRYRSINPALGVTQGLGNGITLFANAARNTRVPTVIELGCADPAEPCRLPAGLQSDPYLKQVRSTTFEAGLRYGGALGASGSVALYRTDNRDDILFSSISTTGQQGYFRNFDRTRHQGVDVEWHWRTPTLDFGVTYNHLEATYQAAGTLRMGERNVDVQPGTRIAGLPRHVAKFSVDWQWAPGLTIGGDLQALSRRGASGNEDGRFEDDEEETADFSLPGYAIVNLRAAWRPAALKGVELTARVTNLFDRRYASYGALAETLFAADGSYTGAERAAMFVAPGAPRALFVGASVKF
jgi:outer membrane cobalamin receptor